MGMAKSHSLRFTALLLFSLAFDFGVNGSDMKLDPNSILKTIVAGDETIDCVDIYKQPAFKHPLLKNHTLRLKPSSYQIGSKSKAPVNSSTKHVQMWHRNGDYCPEGTVPILRSSTTDIPPKNTHRLNAKSNSIPHPELATAFLKGVYMYGLNAEMSVWNPKVAEADESSTSQVWVTDGGGGPNIEAIEAGWMVKPSRPHPVLFIYWTIDGYGELGCYNLDCPGFVLKSSKYSFGSQVQPTSTYGGDQYSLSFKIYKDFKTSDWWLDIEGTDVGYWPAELFEKLNKYSELLEWGGRVVNTDPDGKHTTTQMGSGHFPDEGNRRAAWFKKLEYIDENGFFSPVVDLETRATRPECYDVKVRGWDKEVGASFLYGGPGYSFACRD